MLRMVTSLLRLVLAAAASFDAPCCEQQSKKMITLGITGPEGHEMCRPEEVTRSYTLSVSSIILSPFLCLSLG